MMRAPCSIEGCDKESRGRGWCATHWSRWRKHGDPLRVMVAGVDFRVRKEDCDVADCEKPHLSRGYCAKHLHRFLKHGDTETIGKSGRPLSGDIPTFTAIHRRLYRFRGSASKHLCVDCGLQAREWSYNNSDPNEVKGPCGEYTLSYSLDLQNYEPRCVSCHRKFDMKVAREKSIRADMHVDRDNPRTEIEIWAIREEVSDLDGEAD